MREYRIVKDCRRGFSVQVRRWWWPFWAEAGIYNSCHSVEDAEKYAEGHAQGLVKYLGTYKPKEEPSNDT